MDRGERPAHPQRREGAQVVSGLAPPWTSRMSEPSPSRVTEIALTARGEWEGDDARFRSARNPSVTRRARFTAARRPASFHAPVLEVGDAGRLDGPDLLELHLRVPEVVEEASTVAEHHRNDVELKLVQQSRCQVLL